MCTDAVLAALNQQLPSVSVTPLPARCASRHASGVRPAAKTMIDIRGVMAALPHRYPMLLVDRVEELVKDERIVAIKAVTINEGFFAGHFPGRPIMPGVLIVEALAQAAGILAVESLGLAGSGKLVYFMAIDGAKFRAPVEPGVLLRLECSNSSRSGRACASSPVAR